MPPFPRLDLSPALSRGRSPTASARQDEALPLRGLPAPSPNRGPNLNRGPRSPANLHPRNLLIKHISLSRKHQKMENVNH